MNRTVDINRVLRRAGLLEVHTQDGMEYLDPMASRAFAVADHQIAHVYVRRPEDLDATRAALEGLPGIDQLLDHEGKKAHHLDHPRAGELVAVAEPDAWFTTTTGSTTTAHPTSRSSSRSTANPATTRSSSSWTPSTRTSR
ncbi:hypothetical protein SHIRM173S_06117 [Streptomyces hirsutus]